MPDPIVVSWSEIDAMRQCPHKHMLAYLERWTPPTLSPALARGQLWHSVLEAHYRTLKAQDERIARFERGRLKEDKVQLVVTARSPVHSLLYDEREQQTEDQELIEWMYDGYVAFWGLDAGYTIEAVEHEAEMPLFDHDLDEWSRFSIKMKIDLVVTEQETDQLWLWDHKSGKDLPKEKELALDDQFGLYTLGMRRLGRPVHGAIYNAARTQRNQSAQTLDSRFSRTRLYRTDTELNTIEREALRTVRRAYAKNNQSERHPNPDTCRWRCSYLEPCLAARKGVDEIDFLQSAGFRQDFSRH